MSSSLRWATLTCLAAILLSASPARAERQYHHAGRIGLGARAGWYRGSDREALLRGAGMMTRYQINRRFGAEVSAGLFYPTDPGTCDCVLDLRTAPIDLAMLGFLFPDSPFSLYGLIGVAGEVTQVQVKEDATDEVGYDERLYVRYGGEIGVGAEISFGSRFAVTADGRYIAYLGEPVPDPVGAALAAQNTMHVTVGLHYFF